MVHVIFLLKTSHPMDYHKTGDMIFARLQEIWIFNKERRETMCHSQRGPHVRFVFLSTEATFTGDFSATARSPAQPRAPT